MTTLNTPPPTRDLDAMQQNLAARLGRVGSRIRTQIVLDAVARAAVVVLGLLTLSLLLDWWLELSRPVRVLYWLFTLAAGAHFLYHFAVKPLRKKLGPVQVAEAVDVARGLRGTAQLAPRVATVLQLPAMFADDEALSATMIHDAVGRSYRSLEQADFDAALSSKHMMQCVGALVAALIVPTIVAGVMNVVGDGAFGTWASRWLMLSDEPYPRNTSIEVVGLNEDGALIIPAGENVTLRATITTKNGKEVSEARLTLRPDSGKSRTEALAKFDATDYRLDLGPQTGDARATLRAGDQSLRFTVVPAARPRLSGLKLTHTHPADPQTTRTIDFNGAEGEIALLELNKVELRLTANVPIAEARYVYDTADDAQRPDLPEIRRVGPAEFAIAWEHHDRMRFRIELVGEKAGLVSQPIPISVGLKTDRKPTVRVRSSGVGQRITPNAMIPLNVEARDDYGLRDMAVQVVRERTGGDDQGAKTFDPAMLYQAGETVDQREARGSLGLEVDEYGVVPTDILRITGVATDDRYTGVQTGESTTLTFRIVTHKELFREIIARQQQARAAFRQAIEDSKDIHAELLQANSGARAAALAGRFRTIQRNVWKVNNELGRSAEEMRLNRLGGTKEEGNAAYESMRTTILDPMAKLHDQTMAAQRDAIERSGPADAAQIAQLAADQEQLVNEMNALLARMDRWDELLDAINQISEVIQQQETLRDKLEELINQQFDDLFDQ